jgi:hypothetical protein
MQNKFLKGILSGSVLLLITFAIPAQGTWTTLTNVTADTSGGGMLLLSDGTVLTKTFTESSGISGVGDIWDRLIPDSTGSYVNGSWQAVAPMNSSRLYFSSQLLKDGRLYVAGGEYGTGLNKAETYNSLNNTWTSVPVPAGDTLYDANSAMLPDGRVLQAVLVSHVVNANIFFNPLTNTYSSAPSSHGCADEASYVKLPDNSILFIQNPIVTANYRSERYIPATNQWVQDAFLPDSLWKFGEIGTGMLLPNGKAIFFGASGHTAYYTPSGNASAGSWIAGPDLPSGLGTPDAPAALLPNGHILLAASPIPTSDTTVFLTPAYLFEFDYTNNTFTPVPVPGGAGSVNTTCYELNMLNLPDGSVMLSDMGDTHYYVYQSTGSPLAMAKPTISQITQQGCKFAITGTLFNGISEGSSYGDDWQTATNYPIIRLTLGSNVYYARSFNWNRTGVQTGSLADTAQFTLPAGLKAGIYSVVVTANGVASDPMSLNYTPCFTGIAEEQESLFSMKVFPNPTNELTHVEFQTMHESPVTIRMIDLLGRAIYEESRKAETGNNSFMLNTGAFPKGIYLLSLQQEGRRLQTTVVVE